MLDPGQREGLGLGGSIGEFRTGLENGIKPIG